MNSYLILFCNYGIHYLLSIKLTICLYGDGSAIDQLSNLSMMFTVYIIALNRAEFVRNIIDFADIGIFNFRLKVGCKNPYLFTLTKYLIM